MSLEQLIEEDMRRFVDSESRTENKDAVVRIEEAFHGNRDWEAEIRTQLKRNDVQAARRIFNELKHRYEEIPVDHKAEKKSTYDVLQNCYLILVNATQDHARTQIILQRMEQSQDVFDSNVKPVNLHTMQREKTVAPELVPLTPVSPEAPKLEISMPPSPVTDAPPTVAPVIDTKAILQSFKEQCIEAMKLAHSDPAAALRLIDQIRLTFEHAELHPATLSKIQQKIASIETAVHAYEAKLVFDKKFHHAKNELLTALNVGAVNTHSLLHELAHRCSTFENAYPEYVGEYTSQLKELQRQHGLYSDDELADAVIEIFGRIKTARSRGERGLFVEAVNDIEKLAAPLPHNQQRALLEQAVKRLRSKANKEVHA